MLSPAEEVKSRLDVVEIVSSYLKLQQVGANLKGLCPFHHEKTPSFYVSKEKQIWHCFGCGQGGDVFSFVMKIDGVEFPEALRMLADRAGVTIRQEDPRVRSERTRMYDTLKTASAFYQEALAREAERDVREYLLRRGLAAGTVEEFRLGYAASATWDALVRHLKFKGFALEEAERAGLAVRNDRGDVRDRFHNRIMFPISDIQGNVAGFSGRLFDARNAAKAESAPPKYLNTPETLLYNKGKLLYGLHAAKDAIRTAGHAVLVEGQMDLVLSHQVGVRQTVATSGTALTPDHVRLLKRHTAKVYTAFDGDTAGQMATKRSVMLLLANDIDVRVISFEGGKDPADMICQDPLVWQCAIGEGVPLVDYYMRRALLGRSMQTANEKRDAVDEVLPFIHVLPNPVLRGHYMGRLASAVELDERYVHEALDKFSHEAKNRSRPAQEVVTYAAPQARNRWTDIEEFLLAFMLKHPVVARFHAHLITEDAFTQPHTRAIFRAFIAAIVPADSKEQSPIDLSLSEELRAHMGRMHLKADRYMESIEQLNPELEIRSFVKELQIHALKDRLRLIAKSIQQAADADARHALLSQFSDVSQELQNFEKQDMVQAREVVSA